MIQPLGKRTRGQTIKTKKGGEGDKMKKARVQTTGYDEKRDKKRRKQQSITISLTADRVSNTHMACVIRDRLFQCIHIRFARMGE